MGRDLTLLVLGVGGNVGQGILKALAASDVHCNIIGGCVSANSMGLYLCDHALLTPFADDPKFPKWVADTCQKYSVAGILSGVEHVLNVLAKNASELHRVSGAHLLVSPVEKLRICGDKLHTARWLEQNGLNFPRSVDSTDTDAVYRLALDCGFPLFAKPRTGKGSRGIMRIEEETGLSMVIGRINYVVQEYLGSDKQEYTASTFSDRDGVVRGCIVFQRELLEGTTVSARVVDEPGVRAEVFAIANVLKPVGPCNMQLRIENGRPTCFEINLRYSGTTPIRAQLGFNDVEAGVRHYILGEPAAVLRNVTEGVALRYWNELYITSEAVDACRRNGELKSPRAAVTKIERLGRLG